MAGNESGKKEIQDISAVIEELQADVEEFIDTPLTDLRLSPDGLVAIAEGIISELQEDARRDKKPILSFITQNLSTAPYEIVVQADRSVDNTLTTASHLLMKVSGITAKGGVYKDEKVWDDLIEKQQKTYDQSQEPKTKDAWTQTDKRKSKKRKKTKVVTDAVIIPEIEKRQLTPIPLSIPAEIEAEIENEETKEEDVQPEPPALIEKSTSHTPSPIFIITPIDEPDPSTRTPSPTYNVKQISEPEPKTSEKPKVRFQSIALSHAVSDQGSPVSEIYSPTRSSGPYKQPEKKSSSQPGSPKVSIPQTPIISPTVTRSSTPKKSLTDICKESSLFPKEKQLFDDNFKEVTEVTIDFEELEPNIQKIEEVSKEIFTSRENIARYTCTLEELLRSRFKGSNCSCYGRWLEESQKLRQDFDLLLLKENVFLNSNCEDKHLVDQAGILVDNVINDANNVAIEKGDFFYRYCIFNETMNPDDRKDSIKSDTGP